MKLLNIVSSSIFAILSSNADADPNSLFSSEVNVIFADGNGTISVMLDDDVEAPSSAPTDGNASSIIDGSPMAPGSRPYLVSIGNNLVDFPFGFHSCGASLISPRAVLTAAHCVSDGPNSLRPPDWIDFTRHDLRDPPTRRVVFGNVPNTILHPQWNRATFAFDVAILILTPGDAINDIIPVLLNDNPNIPAIGAPLDIAGWGANQNFFPPARPPPVFVPTQITVAYTEQSTTEGNCPRQPYDLCTIDSAGGNQRVCAGDSGGPLVVSIGEPDLGPVFPAVQVGIVSRGERRTNSGHCGVNVPSIYTRVSAISAWVRATVCARVGELCTPLPPTPVLTQLPTPVTTQRPTLGNPKAVKAKGGKKTKESKVNFN